MATVCLAPHYAHDDFPLSPLFTSCNNDQSTRMTQEDNSMILLSHQFSAQSLAPRSTQRASRPTTSDSTTTDDEPSPWATNNSLFRTIDFSGGIPAARRHMHEHIPDSYSPLDSPSSDSSRSNSVSSASSATSYASSTASNKITTLSITNDKRTPRHPARPHTRCHRTPTGSPPTHRLQRRNALHADSSPRVLALLWAKAAQQSCADDAEMAIDATDDEDCVDAACRGLGVVSRRNEYLRERHAARTQRRKVVGCDHGPRRVT